MAKKKKPSVEIPTICILCTQLCEERLDKYNRPYVSCPACGTKFFLRTPMAQAGYALTSRAIYMNLGTHTQELQTEYAALLEKRKKAREKEAREEARKEKAKNKKKKATSKK